MTSTSGTAEIAGPVHGRGGGFLRLAIIIAGIAISQCFLYGPSLLGRKVLLPLDYLGFQNCYLPNTIGMPNGYPQDPVTGDLVLIFEPDRRFAVREFQAGRFPSWIPNQFGGCPFIGPRFSPFFLLTCLTPSPVVLAWVQLLAAMIAGTGAYAFFRRVLGVNFWPAALASWCYPMTGEFILWHGFLGPIAIYWLPWLLLAVDWTVRGGCFGPVYLAIMTGLVLVSGHADIGALMLLVAGLFALWRIFEIHGLPLIHRGATRMALILTLSWGLGCLLAMPNILPVITYAKTGLRMQERFNGKPERPPVGLAALPQVVLPGIYGSYRKDCYPMFPPGENNLPESAASGYAGILAALMLAPWAWCNLRRSLNAFWVLLMVVGLSWCLNLPGFVQLMHLPGLAMLSFNRFVFATPFAFLALAAVGLDALWEGKVQWRHGFWLPVGLLLALGGWCIYRANVLPEPLATQLEKNIAIATQHSWNQNIGDLHETQAAFSKYCKISALWCGLGLLGWSVVRLHRQRMFVFGAGGLLLGELLWFSHGRIVQSDPALYFPEIPALREMARATPGRMMGNGCLPANMSEAAGLCDVRGYDGIDPARWVPLVLSAANTNSQVVDFELTGWLAPQGKLSGNTVLLPPILNLLGVRYVVFRGDPPPEITPAFRSPDYWIAENPSALPRIFVPRRVEVVKDDRERMEKLSSPDFNPCETAFVEEPVDLPSQCAGKVEIKSEIPTRILVAAQMETPGMVVLADRWDAGWRAYVNGQRAPIFITDHALRGVVVPKGLSSVEFRYQPASVAASFTLAGGALAVLLGWLAGGLIAGRRRK